MITMTIYTLHSKASSKILIYTVTKGGGVGKTVILKTGGVIKQLHNQTSLLVIRTILFIYHQILSIVSSTLKENSSWNQVTNVPLSFF